MADATTSAAADRVNDSAYSHWWPDDQGRLEVSCPCGELTRMVPAKRFDLAPECDEHTDLECQFCGIRFNWNNPNAGRPPQYCGPTCRKEGRKATDRKRHARQRRPTVVTRECQECSQTFSYQRGPGSQPVYCSDTCRQEGNKRLRRKTHR